LILLIKSHNIEEELDKSLILPLPNIKETKMLNNQSKDLDKVPAVKELSNETAETVGGGWAMYLYQDINQGGRRLRFNYGTSDLRKYNFNDKLSSFVVNSGGWRLYKHINFIGPVGRVFRRGVYNWVENYGVPNDSVSSLRKVQQ